jgi:hypothetical protein
LIKQKIESASLKIGHLRLLKRRKRKNIEETLCKLQDTIKQTNMCFMGFPGRAEKKKGAENLFKEKKSDKGREMNIQVHEVQNPQIY